MKKLLTFLMLIIGLSASATNWYCTPKDGRSTDTGDGSAGNPWDLSTALQSKASVIQPGDTIWLNAGTYHHSFLYGGSAAYNYTDGTGTVVPLPTMIDVQLHGSTSSPIVVQPMPGARATIDGWLRFGYGGTSDNCYSAHFIGLELECTYTNRYDPAGGGALTGAFVQMRDGSANGVDKDLNTPLVAFYQDTTGANVSDVAFINCIVHDGVNGGIGGAAPFIYGSLAYNGGFYDAGDRAHGHGMYIQNKDSSMTCTFKNNILCNNAFEGFQWNGKTACYYNTLVDGLITYQNAKTVGPQPDGRRYDGNGSDIDFATQGSGPISNSGFINCCLWDQGFTNASTWCLFNSIGASVSGSFLWTNCLFCVDQTNYLGYQEVFQGSMPTSGSTVTGNKFYGGSWSSLSSSFPNNTYKGNAPTSGTDIYVYPNAYEAGRANIAIYNWARTSTVTVDISKLNLPSGTAYELHNCQDFYGDIICGTYNGGGTITVPMTGHSVAQPIGKNLQKAPSSFPTFGAFILRQAQGGNPSTNTPPTITGVSDQTIAQGTATAPLGFTVGDAETPSANLSVTANSSSQTLVPDANIVLGGSGANRTVTVTPVSTQSGSATITLIVSDGTTSSSTSFTLTVTPGNTPPTISGVAAQSVPVNTATAALPFTVGDNETADASLTVTASSSNPTLVPNSGIILGGSDDTRTVTVTPATGQSGTATITLTVSDGSLTASTSFTVSVFAPPATLIRLAIPAASGVMAAPMAVTTDASNPNIKYISSTAANSGTATYTINIPQTDTYVVWCKVLCPSYTNDSFFVTMDGAQDVFDAAENAWSPDWQWACVNGRNGTSTPLTLNPRTFTLTAGQHTLAIGGREATAAIERILITNDRFCGAPQEVQATNDAITAAANTPRVINPSELLGNDSSLFGDTLQISAVGTAQNGAVLLAGGTVTYTPNDSFVGQDTFTYTVSDSVGATSTAMVTVTVNSSNTPPPTPVRIWISASSGTIVAPMSVATDASTPSVTYIRSTVANQGTASYTLNIPQSGTYVVWCKVLCPSYTNDSFFVSMDGVEDIYDAVENRQSPNWQWTQVNGRNGTPTPQTLNPRAFSLAAGQHALVVRGREATAGLAQFFITTDQTCTAQDVATLSNALSGGNPPPIGASLSGKNSLGLSWPVNAGGYILEQTTDLCQTNSWVPVTQPITTNGNQISITLPTTGSNMWFRLRQTQ